MVRGREREAAADDGQAEKGSLRLCVATRAERPPEDLIRFVASPEGVLVPDLARRLPGRGVWVTGERSAVERAVTSKAFARSLKAAVTVARDLPEQVEGLIVKRVMDALSLANKAGLAVPGFAQASAALDKGAVVVLIHGSDAALDGRQKLDRKLSAICRAGGREPRVADCLSIEQLSLAMGRSNVVHAALIAGGATERFWIEAERLRRYRPERDVLALAVRP